MSESCCESCGSNIVGETPEHPHLCSIMTADGWRRQIPLHRRGHPLFPPTARVKLSREDRQMVRDWLAKHESADALVYDTRTGQPIQAIYTCPAAMHQSETVDFWTNAGRLVPLLVSDDPGEPA